MDDTLTEKLVPKTTRTRTTTTTGKSSITAVAAAAAAGAATATATAATATAATTTNVITKNASHFKSDRSSLMVGVDGTTGDDDNDNNNDFFSPASSTSVSTIMRGEEQVPKCRDWIYALIFVLHVLILFTLCMIWGVPTLYKDASSSSGSGVSANGGGGGGGGGGSSSSGGAGAAASDGGGGDYGWGIVQLLLLSSFFISCFFSALALFLLMKYSKSIIQLSLYFTMSISLISSTWALIMGNAVGFFIGLVFFAVNAYYSYIVWKRIPFAATNLNVALNGGIREYWGIVWVSYALVGIAFVYTWVWTLAFIGVVYSSSSSGEGVFVSIDNDGGGRGSDKNDSLFSYSVLLLVLVYFWTQQVVQNTAHVTIAGVIGTWWFNPSSSMSMSPSSSSSSSSSSCSPRKCLAAGCWSNVIQDSFVRATTLSFGSICLGSLLVAILQTFRFIIDRARRHGGGDNNEVLLCILNCIMRLLEDAMKYFNKWAYVYIGLYGYEYTTAGRKVIELFRFRGWSNIITDDLITNALFLINLIVAFMTGLVVVVAGVLIFGMTETVAGSSAFGDHGAMLVSFFIAFMIGFVVSSILMSIVTSAVNTIIVCFAEAPGEFQTNYPELSEQMRLAWKNAYPNDFVDFS